jgi:zinc finger SWIM domain-containing protein 3
VERMLTLKANKKLVQQTAQQQTGKCITLKDLSNISTRMKASLRSNNLGDLEQLFQEHEGGSTMVLVDEATNSFRAILYQDSYVRSVFAQYPEMLLVDATYKLLDLRMPVYIMMAIDGNGLSEVVAVFIVAEETFVTISSTIEAFTDSNPAATHTKVIMTDKDFTERNALRAHFPNAAFTICLYHVLRTFRREVTIEKMCITSAQRDACLTVLQKLAYSQSADECDIHVQELQNLNFERVTAYFLASWHGLKEEWVEGLKNVNMNFGQSTNNRLESLNGKLKSVCSAYSSLRQFFSDLFLVLATLRNERMHKAVLMQVKRPTIEHSRRY